MREGLPSLTAMVVAAARAGRDLDPYAATLLPPAVGRLAEPLAPLLAGRLSFGLGTHLALRTRAIDAALAKLTGITQLVILGAGLDARAHRLPIAAEWRTFEIDHPSTQRYKERRLRQSPLPASAVTFVPVDFARDDLNDRLAAAGHDPARPTVFLWEGVTMYLPRAATLATLDCVARRAASGSVLVTSYVTPEMTKLGPLVDRIADLAFRAIGEPLVGAIESKELAAELEARRFSVLSDEGARDWRRTFAPTSKAPLVVNERLMVARRT